jgi:SpoVK/Ycf46/Vps4 family AAA+-type ATPase
MRRVLNAFLQFIERDISDSLIIAATNSPKLLDRALFRRFDDVLYYSEPEIEDRQKLIRNILGSFFAKDFSWRTIIHESDGLSHAEIAQACRDAIKQVILTDGEFVSVALLQQMLKERRGAHQKPRG